LLDELPVWFAPHSAAMLVVLLVVFGVLLIAKGLGVLSA
jgi:hypothetical protein